MITRNRISRFTARLSPLLCIPKTAKAIIACASVVVSRLSESWGVLQEDPTEQVPDPEEDQNRRRHEECNQTDHRQEPRLFGGLVEFVPGWFTARGHLPSSQRRGVF